MASLSIRAFRVFCLFSGEDNLLAIELSGFERFSGTSIVFCLSPERLYAWNNKFEYDNEYSESLHLLTLPVNHHIRHLIFFCVANCP